MCQKDWPRWHEVCFQQTHTKSTLLIKLTVVCQKDRPCRHEVCFQQVSPTLSQRYSLKFALVYTSRKASSNLESNKSGLGLEEKALSLMSTLASDEGENINNYQNNVCYFTSANT